METKGTTAPEELNVLIAKKEAFEDWFKFHTEYGDGDRTEAEMRAEYRHVCEKIEAIKSIKTEE